MIYDITPPMTRGIAVWPGDTRLSREVNTDIMNGDVTTVSTVRTTVHVGAHADAMGHFVRGGLAIDEHDVRRYVGPCEVIRLSENNHQAILPQHLRAPPKAPRVLFATESWRPDERGFEVYQGLHPDTISLLASQGVMLVGIDTPSVDVFTSTLLETHKACGDHDVYILEGLDLTNIDAGVYELIALPLRLAGFDASPVRAVLRTPEPATAR